MGNDKRFIKDFKEYVNNLGVKSVLEVGAQTGELMEAVGGIGIDLEPSRSDVQKCDIRQYHGKKCELVFSSGLIEYYNEDEAIEVLQAMAKASNKYVLTYVPNTNCEAYMDTKKNHSQHWPQSWREEDDYTPERLAKLHEKAGLVVVEQGETAVEWARLFNKTLPTGGGYLAWVLAKLPEKKPNAETKKDSKKTTAKK
jgi:hypothetical protein